jgi:divalent metal cation (Fe/Co/Zn/Cd) transporter
MSLLAPGREINSAALIADGYDARIDGWTSLAVLFGEVGVWLGYPLAGIFGIVIQSGKSIFFRMLDGAEPQVIDELRHTAEHVPQVKEVTEVRARWLGHRLHELNLAVDPQLTIAQAHAVAAEVPSPLGLCVARRHTCQSGGSTRRGTSSHSKSILMTGCPPIFT